MTTLDLATLMQLRQRFASTVLAAAGDAAADSALRFQNVRELEWWDEMQLDRAIKVTFSCGAAFSRARLFDRRKASGAAYVIESCGARIYFAGRHGILNLISLTSRPGLAPRISRCSASAPTPALVS